MVQNTGVHSRGHGVYQAFCDIACVAITKSLILLLSLEKSIFPGLRDQVKSIDSEAMQGSVIQNKGWKMTHCRFFVLPILLASTLSCDGDGSSGSSSSVPVGDPTASYGEITADDAKTFLVAQLGVSESVSMMGVSQESAANVKAQVGQAPNNGTPDQDVAELRLKPSMNLVANTCTVTSTGDKTDADGDYLAVDQTTDYDCSIDNSANTDFWSWTSKGKWAMKDHDDTVKGSGGRYTVSDYTYSGSYKNAAGEVQTYKGSTDGYSDWSKKDSTATSELRFATEYQRNDKSAVKTIYINKTSFAEDTASVASNRQGTLQLSGYVRSEVDGKVVILAQEGKDLVVDSATCNYSGFKTGTMTFTDAKGHKLVVTYVACKRVITLDEQELPAPESSTDVVDGSMLACKSYAAEGGDNAVAGADLIMYKCENVSISATGVVGTTDDEKMAYLKDICVSGRGQGSTYRTQAVVGRICPTPTEKLGYSCVNAQIVFNGTVNKTLFGNTYTYLKTSGREKEGSVYQKDSCEFPSILDPNTNTSTKSTVKVGTFTEY